MLVVIRADASREIGSGHVTRCLTLAEGLRSVGATVEFVTRSYDGNLIALIERRGFVVHGLPVNGAWQPEGHAALQHAGWLGATPEDDARETLEAVGTRTVQIWIVDHYGIDERWESAVRSAGDRLLAIDDLADRLHACDILLDQNLIKPMEARYDGLVSASTVRLVGPTYALLQPAYGDWRRRLPPRNGAVRRILVSFGGADLQKVTERTVEAFLRLARTDVILDVVAPAGEERQTNIEALAAGHRNIRVHRPLPSLAPLMAHADLAIGAAGSSSWERLCLGLPTLLVTLAENQRPIARSLDEEALAQWIGDAEEVSAERLERELRTAIANGVDRSRSERCMSTVDGRGVSRVLAALLDGAGTLCARPAELDDAEELGYHDRRDYEAQLRDLEAQRWFIVEDVNGEHLGDVRFRRHDLEWVAEPRMRPGYGARAARRVLAAGWHALRRDLDGPVRMATSRTGGLRLTIASATASWMNAHIPDFAVSLAEQGHQVTWIHQRRDIAAGDICMLLSFTEVIGPEILALHRNNVVVHASALPKGRGWSPWVWQILEGHSSIPVSLIEAEPELDSGRIYAQSPMNLHGTELLPELRHRLAELTFALCQSFITGYPATAAAGRPQAGSSSFYPRRRPEASQLALDQPLREQLDLLRTVDNDHFPAWLDLRGRRIRLRVEPWHPTS